MALAGQIHGFWTCKGARQKNFIICVCFFSFSSFNYGILYYLIMFLFTPINYTEVVSSCLVPIRSGGNVIARAGRGNLARSLTLTSLRSRSFGGETASFIKKDWFLEKIPGVYNGQWQGWGALVNEAVALKKFDRFSYCQQSNPPISLFKHSSYPAVKLLVGLE